MSKWEEWKEVFTGGGDAWTCPGEKVPTRPSLRRIVFYLKHPLLEELSRLSRMEEKRENQKKEMQSETLEGDRQPLVFAHLIRSRALWWIPFPKSPLWECHCCSSLLLPSKRHILCVHSTCCQCCKRRELDYVTKRVWQARNSLPNDHRNPGRQLVSPIFLWLPNR